MAYMRVTRSQFDPARYEEVLSVNADLAGILQQLPGFQHYHQGVDRATGKSIIMTIFDTLEHAQFSRESLGEIIPRFQALGLSMEAPELYEIIS